MKKTRFAALSVAALMLGTAGAFAGTSQASASTDFALQNIASITEGNVALCIATSGGYAYLLHCTFSDPTQVWHKGVENSGFYQLVNNDGQCLSIYGGGDQQDERIGAGTCNTLHPDQYWDLDQQGGNAYQINNYHSGYLVTPYNDGLTIGTELVQHSDNNTEYQEFSQQTQS